MFVRVLFYEIAVNKRHGLCTGAGQVGRECVCAGTLGYAVCGCPCDSLGVPCVRRNIVKGGPCCDLIAGGSV